MWLLVCFDVPTDSGKNYRNLRNTLISHGFCALQKSVYWRWEESRERIRTLRSKIVAAASHGTLLFLTLSKSQWKEGNLWKDGKPLSAPEPPSPWRIL